MRSFSLGRQVVNTGKKLIKWPKIRGTARQMSFVALKRWDLLLLAISFLLGRAVILDQVSPFALPFLAVVYYLKRNRLLPVVVFLLIGASTVDGNHLAWLTTLFALFFLLQKGTEQFKFKSVNYVPLIVFCTLLVAASVRLGFTGWTLYDGVLAAIEVVIGVLLTFIFVQSLPLITNKRRQFTMKPEEIVSLVILLATVMTGMTGWTIGGLSVEHIFSRYFILLFALVGGGMLGATVGVVIGMILSLSNQQAMWEISLLAFTGLLSGLFREGKKLGVAVGFFIGTSILALYAGMNTLWWTTIQESALAVLLFLLTPSTFAHTLSRYIPGTTENVQSQHEYARRVRDLTAKKVEQFSHVFTELSHSFSDKYNRPQQDEAYLQQFVDTLSDTACSRCRKYDECWGPKFVQTYTGLTDLIALVELEGNKGHIRVPKEWDAHCIRSERMMARIKKQYDTYQYDLYWQERLRETQQIVAEQLSGMSQVMLNWAGEIRRETEVLSAQEEQIQTALEDLGLAIDRIDVVSLEEGNVEVEVTLPENDHLDSSRKVIAPLLTDVIGEHITVYTREGASDRTEGVQTVVFGSAQNFDVQAGVAAAAKGGGWLSGDSYSYSNLGTGKYAVAISDGMGNGVRAREESQAALKLLGQLLQSGMEERIAAKTVNAILGIRSTDEMFATIDLALIDLDTARTTFLKIGSAPSFIKRGNEVICVTASNLPLGILQDIDVDTVHEQLLPGDVLVMMTDGVYDALEVTVHKEEWFKRAIGKIKTQEPQGVADVLLEKMVREQDGAIEDDMTVVVAKIDHSLPDWQTIAIPGMPRLSRHEAPQH